MLVSIIIPCKDDHTTVADLLKDISEQKTSFSVETIRITGISPPGKARNQGVAQAKGDFFIFLDCDVRLGQQDFLERLVSVLRQDPSVGASCGAIRLPQQANAFQKSYAAQIPHCESPLVDKITDVQVASSACFAISRELFQKLGGFNEQIPRGEDSVISDAVQHFGKRTVLAPGIWVYHPVPANMKELAMMNCHYGRGAAYVDAFFPQLNLDVDPRSVVLFSPRKNIFERLVRFITSAMSAVVRGRFLLLARKFFYAIGYSWGLLKHQVLRERGF